MPFPSFSFFLVLLNTLTIRAVCSFIFASLCKFLLFIPYSFPDVYNTCCLLPYLRFTLWIHTVYSLLLPLMFTIHAICSLIFVSLCEFMLFIPYPFLHFYNTCCFFLSPPLMFTIHVVCSFIFVPLCKFKLFIPNSSPHVYNTCCLFPYLRSSL